MVDKTKKYLVGINGFNNATLVKRDLLTGKYISDKDYTNVLLIFTLAILLVGMFVYIFIPHIHGIIVSEVMIQRHWGWVILLYQEFLIKIR